MPIQENQKNPKQNPAQGQNDKNENRRGVDQNPFDREISREQNNIEKQPARDERNNNSNPPLEIPDRDNRPKEYPPENR